VYAAGSRQPPISEEGDAAQIPAAQAGAIGGGQRRQRCGVEEIDARRVVIAQC
jgi:hypothetical protein